jgi:hypothetical protein
MRWMHHCVPWCYKNSCFSVDMHSLGTSSTYKLVRTTYKVMLYFWFRSIQTWAKIQCYSIMIIKYKVISQYKQHREGHDLCSNVCHHHHQQRGEVNLYKVMKCEYQNRFPATARQRMLYMSRFLYCYHDANERDWMEVDSFTFCYETRKFFSWPSKWPQ